MGATLDEVLVKLEEVCKRVEHLDSRYSGLSNEAKTLKEVAQKLATAALQIQAARIAAAIVPGPARMLYIAVPAFLGGFAAELAAYWLHFPHFK